MKKVNIDRYKTGELIYLIYFTLMMGARAAGMYEGTAIYTVTLLISLALFAAKMLITPHTLKEYAIASVLLLIAGIVYLHTGEKGLIVCFCMLLGMKGVSRIKALKYGSAAAALCISLRIITGAAGILPEKYYPQMREGFGTMFRHALGYAHPNTLHMNVLMLTMLTGYLTVKGLSDRDKKEGLPLLSVISALLLGFNLYVFQYSGSRTGVLASVVFLALNIWFYLRPVPGLFEKAVCYAAYPFVCFLAIVVPFILPEKIFTFVDKVIFNTRFSLGLFFWEHNRLSLWGIRLNKPDPTLQTYGIDMSHLYLFLQLGVIAFTLISVMTLVYVHNALKRAYAAELAVLLSTLFAGIWEPYLYNLGFKNFTYVFMGAMLYELTSGEVIRDDPSLIKLPSVRSLLKSMAVGLVTGLLAAVIFITVTKIPGALYADREQNEAGISFGMEPVYLTEEDIDAIRDSGDLVVGYKDADTPMYIYDEGIAVKEYHKKALSLFVWCGAFASGAAYYLFGKTRTR